MIDRIKVKNVKIDNPVGIGKIGVPVIPGGINDYTDLENKPSINEVELVDNKQLEDLNINRLTNLEIEDIINSVI